MRSICSVVLDWVRMAAPSTATFPRNTESRTVNVPDPVAKMAPPPYPGAELLRNVVRVTVSVPVSSKCTAPPRVMVPPPPLDTVICSNAKAPPAPTLRKRKPAAALRVTVPFLIVMGVVTIGSATASPS